MEPIWRVTSIGKPTQLKKNRRLQFKILLFLFIIFLFIIKFPYNARSDWLKQRALPEIKKRVDDIKLAFKFLLRNLDKFDPNYKHPLCDSDKINLKELFVSTKYGS